MYPPKFYPAIAPRRYKGLRGGRGSGKSHFVAQLLVSRASTEHRRIVCGREIQRSIADSSKKLIEDKIIQAGLTNLFKITDSEISCPSTDSLFIFKGLRDHTAATIKSMEGFHDLWLEEAQTISKMSLEMAIPTFRQEGGEIICSWNPDEPDDPVEVFFEENKDDPDFICIHTTYEDNTRFPDVLRKDMERDKRRDPDKYAHIWLGHFKKRTGERVFRNWTVRDFETPENVRFYFGADWGFANDPTVLIRCWIDEKQRILYVDYEVVKVGCEIDDTPTLFEEVPESKKWPIVADNARPETISYMQRNGYPRMIAAKKGANSVEDGVEFLKSYDIVVHPRCKTTIDELSTYSYEVDKKTQQILPVLADKDNHVIDSLRYALENARRAEREGGNFSPRSVPKIFESESLNTW